MKMSGRPQSATAGLQSTNKAPEEAGAHGSQQDYDCARGLQESGVDTCSSNESNSRSRKPNEEAGSVVHGGRDPTARWLPCGRSDEPLLLSYLRGGYSVPNSLALAVARVWCQVSEWKRHCKISRATPTKILQPKRPPVNEWIKRRINPECHLADKKEFTCSYMNFRGFMLL